MEGATPGGIPRSGEKGAGGAGRGQGHEGCYWNDAPARGGIQRRVEAVTVLAQLGADIAARTGAGETTLQASIRNGHHQVAQVLRELERELESAARAQQAAARERAQQAAQQDIAEKREAADRVAAEILAEEEREQAAQTKVRVAPPLAPHWAPQRAVGW